MVSIHEHNSGFIKFFQSRNKILNHIIRLTTLINVIFPRSFLSCITLILSCKITPNMSERISMLLRIASMCLNCYSCNIISSLCLSHTFNHLVVKNIILSPASRSILQKIHVFHCCKHIKSQIGIINISLIKCSIIIMKACRCISISFKIICHAVTGLTFHYRLERILTGTKELGTHSGLNFKLCIGGTCTYRWNSE